MAERQSHQQKYTFKEVQLLKKDTLGTGSYGVVCKAKCDQLICAAKLIYPVLFQIQAPDLGKEYRQPLRRFETECQFLSCINHPNIVQYLGTYHDPENNALVLLMELMDESLTHFLETSTRNLSHHTQINFLYDIAQALAFLHSNGIIHRDLSSNNILLLARNRAKVTDFGMSKFLDLKSTQLATMTTCPGTPAFMPPEALDEPPVYTEKLDNFSFGVLIIQIITMLFPKPTNRFAIRQLFDTKYPDQVIQAKVPVPELERRRAHIDLISPDHPLLPNALHCLKDIDSERPTATQLCQILADLKTTARYKESVQQSLDDLQKEAELLASQELIAHKNMELKKNQELLQANETIIAHKNMLLQANQEMIAYNNDQLLANSRKINQITAQFGHATQNNKVLQQENHTLQQKVNDNEKKLRTLESYERNCTVLQQTLQLRDKEITELRQILTRKTEQVLTIRKHNVALKDEDKMPSPKSVIVGKWQSLPNTSANMWYGTSAVIGDKAYFKSHDVNAVYEFSNNKWKKLRSSPNNYCTIVGVDDILTTVGGASLPTNHKLYSYINSKWVEHFPAMAVGMQNTAAVYTSNTLVVIGGYSFKPLNTVNILNTVSRQWSSVSSLPVTVNHPSVSICENYVYIHPRASSGKEMNFVYKCSLEQLFQSKFNSCIWENITPLPVNFSSLNTVNGHVLAMGGQEANGEYTINIYQYIDSSWSVVGHMQYPRSAPLTAILPGNKLMVVGGGGAPKQCEIAEYN